MGVGVGVAEVWWVWVWVWQRCGGCGCWYGRGVVGVGVAEVWWVRWWVGGMCLSVSVYDTVWACTHQSTLNLLTDKAWNP